MGLPLPVPGTDLDLCISGLNHHGQGVARISSKEESGRDLVVFVPEALPGERVLARVHHRAQRHLVAHPLERRNDAPERRQPPCILASDCGGCGVQHLQDKAQLIWKQDLVQQALRRIGGQGLEVDPILASDTPLGYRNRTTIPLERCPDGQLRAGFYRSGTHRIVNMNRCPVLDPRIDRLIAPLKRDLEQSDWPVDVDLSEGGGLAPPGPAGRAPHR